MPVCPGHCRAKEEAWSWCWQGACLLLATQDAWPALGAVDHARPIPWWGPLGVWGPALQWHPMKGIGDGPAQACPLQALGGTLPPSDGQNGGQCVACGEQGVEGCCWYILKAAWAGASRKGAHDAAGPCQALPQTVDGAHTAILRQECARWALCKWLASKCIWSWGEGVWVGSGKGT